MPLWRERGKRRERSNWSLYWTMTSVRSWTRYKQSHFCCLGQIINKVETESHHRVIKCDVLRWFLSCTFNDPTARISDICFFTNIHQCPAAQQHKYAEIPLKWHPLPGPRHCETNIMVWIQFSSFRNNVKPVITPLRHQSVTSNYNNCWSQTELVSCPPLDQWRPLMRNTDSVSRVDPLPLPTPPAAHSRVS